MTENIASIADVSNRYDAVLCDLWGCLHNGVRPFADAVAALQRYRAQGGFVVLLTNAPRPSSDVRRQLNRIGVAQDAYDVVVSSGDASQAAMVAGLVGRRVYHLGPEKDGCFFTDMARDLDPKSISRVPLNAAEGIVCTGLFDDQSEVPEDYRATLLYASAKGMKLLCTNPDMEVDFGDKRFFCAGILAALYTEMGGESLYFGKPHPPIYILARQRISEVRSVPDDRILCIGDGIRTDILGGLGEGMDTLFISSGLAAGLFGPDPDRPEAPRLAAYFEDQKISPTFAMPFMA
jgi:HAD superfamily hydrolase (TIGR01459 family)